MVPVVVKEFRSKRNVQNKAKTSERSELFRTE